MHSHSRKEELLNATERLARVGGREWEEALRKSEETYRALVEGLPDVVMRFDRDGRHLFASENTRAVTGVPASEMLGRTHRELGFPADMCDFWERAIRQVFETGAPFESEFSYTGVQGEVVFDWRLFPERGPDGQPSFVLSLARDVTAHRKLEAEREKLQSLLLQAQKMESVGRLAGGVAHDFNNMLSVILGRLDMALEDLHASSPMRADLLEARKAAERSADLTRQLLSFARKQPVAPRVLDLNATIGRTLQMIRRLIGEHIELEWKPCPSAWPVRMDPGQVDQILTNICVNARDAIAGAGSIRIQTANCSCTGEGAGVAVPSGEYVVLTIADNGRGMDASTLQHIFEPFFTTKSLGLGTGLGLATVWGIIEQNQGFIRVQSEPGQGTIFTILLPRHASDKASTRNAEEGTLTAQGQETLLVVEDEAAILGTVRLVLEKLGYTVLAASTPEEALDLSERHPGEVDLLLTDVVMPRMNGLELAEALRARRPGLRPLFMSGYTADVVARHGLMDESLHFLQKPFTPSALGARVRDVLGPTRP